MKKLTGIHNKTKDITEELSPYNNINILLTDNDLNNLRLPLRVIDRSKTISLVEREYIDLFGNVKTTMIAIRFPYSNKMIKYIEFIKLLQKNTF